MDLDDSPNSNGRPDAATLALLLIAGILTTAAVTYLGPVFKPFLVAVFLYFLAKSAANFFEKWRLPPWLTYVLLLLVATAVGSVIFLFLSVQVTQLTTELGEATRQRGLINLVNRAIAFSGYSLGDVKIPAEALLPYLYDRSVETLELLGLAIFYLLFMIMGANKVAMRFHKSLPVAYAGPLFKIGEEIGGGMEEFIKVKTLVGLGMGVTSALILLVFGVKYWLLWGFLFFLLNYIHYIGSMAALVPPILLAYVNFDAPVLVENEPVLQFHEPVRASILTALLVFNRFVWIDYVEIRFSGERLNVEPVLMFLWLTYWGWFWGVVGLILAYPMLASLRIILQNFDATKSWAFLMSDE